MGLHNQRAWGSVVLWIHTSQYLVTGEGELCPFPPPCVCLNPPQGDELITACTYNTEDRTKVTVVSAAARTPRGQQLHPEVQARRGGGTRAWIGAESQPPRMGCCSWDAKVLIEKWCLPL